MQAWVFDTNEYGRRFLLFSYKATTKEKVIWSMPRLLNLIFFFDHGQPRKFMRRSLAGSQLAEDEKRNFQELGKSRYWKF
jgi:hypothetical protein